MGVIRVFHAILSIQNEELSFIITANPNLESINQIHSAKKSRKKITTKNSSKKKTKAQTRINNVIKVAIKLWSVYTSINIFRIEKCIFVIIAPNNKLNVF